MLLPLIYMVLIFEISSMPGNHGDMGGFELLGPGLCNLMHLPEYALLFILWFRFFKMRQFPGSTFYTFAVTIAYGVIDELHQSFVPGRYSSPLDLLLDALGAILGFTIIEITRSLRDL